MPINLLGGHLRERRRDIDMIQEILLVYCANHHLQEWDVLHNLYEISSIITRSFHPCNIFFNFVHQTRVIVISCYSRVFFNLFSETTVMLLLILIWLEFKFFFQALSLCTLSYEKVHAYTYMCMCVRGREILIMLASNNHLQVQKENMLLWTGLQELLFA
jgi:hypothetical protein